MTTSTRFDDYMEKIGAGTRLTADDVRELAGTPDILPLGMLADAARRQRHGARATFVRVATIPFDGASVDVPPAAGEVRITGSPATIADAVAAIRAVAGPGRRSLDEGGRPAITAFSWMDIERWANGGDALPILEQLKAEGLDAIAWLPLDRMRDPVVAIDQLARAGFTQLRLGIDARSAEGRTDLFLTAHDLQERFGIIRAISPLPATLNPFRPTTGYDDVKMVAVARLAAPTIASIQVDWQRYGPKLAQVALTFGADDVDNVSALDASPEGRRRAPIEEIRRNIAAAGFEPVERDGHFGPIV